MTPKAKMKHSLDECGLATQRFSIAHVAKACKEHSSVSVMLDLEHLFQSHWVWGYGCGRQLSAKLQNMSYAGYWLHHYFSNSRLNLMKPQL